MRIGETTRLIERALETHLFQIAGTPVNGATLAMAVLIVILTLISSKIIRRAMFRSLTRRGVVDPGTLGGTSRLVHYGILAIGLGIGVHTVGIDLTALFAAGAVFAVAIGFAMQNISQNFVSGVILLIERVIKPGDIVDVEGMRVRVVDMGIRSTVARTLDEEDIIIPNSLLVQSVVKNYSMRDPMYRVRIVVGVEYSSDMALVRRTLEVAARTTTHRSQQSDPVILMTEFGTSSVDWEVSVWIEYPWHAQTIRATVREEIWFALKNAGVVIAFPQVDVHLDPHVERAIEKISGGRA